MTNKIYLLLLSMLCLCLYTPLMAQENLSIISKQSGNIPGFIADPEALQKYVNELVNNVNMAVTDNKIRDTILINQKFDYLYTADDGTLYAVVVNSNGTVTETKVSTNKSTSQCLVTDGKGDSLVISKSGQPMGIQEYRVTGGNKAILKDYHRKSDSLAQWQINFTPYKHQTYPFDRIASGTSVSGYMPRGYNCGFIYYCGSERTIAHELGHGIAGLQHVFENSNNSGKTNNLMDYSTGDELWHFQWDQKVIYDLSLYTPIKSSNKVYIDIIITIQDWYGADEDDFIGNNSLYPQEKHNQLCLNSFFLLQHKFGCSPFITEVIFHDYLEFNFE